METIEETDSAEDLKNSSRQSISWSRFLTNQFKLTQRIEQIKTQNIGELAVRTGFWFFNHNHPQLSCTFPIRRIHKQRILLHPEWLRNIIIFTTMHFGLGRHRSSLYSDFKQLGYKINTDFCYFQQYVSTSHELKHWPLWYKLSG